MTKIRNSMLEMALQYYELGFSIIPVGRDKKPLISWKPYQNLRADKEKITQWFKKFPDMNIGAVTGEISGIVVIDIEKEGSSKGYASTVTSKTGGGGFHLFYKHPGVKIKNSVKDLALLTDVRGDGGYVVLPPSVHSSGNKYEWLIEPQNGAFADLPKEILQKIRVDSKEKVDWKEFSKSKSVKGKRNTDATKYAGKLLHDLSPELWETAGWTSLVEWNSTNSVPPLPTKELRAVFDSIAKNESDRGSSKTKNQDESSLVEKLVEMVVENPQVILFHDEYNTAWASIDNNDHAEIWRCDSRRFTLWIARNFREINKKILSPVTISSAMTIIEGKAIFEGDEYKLSNRVAFEKGMIWYDLANNDWSAVCINEVGYFLSNKVPILFHRHSHLSEQVIPIDGGEVRDVLRYVNITNSDQQILFMIYLVSSFIPGFSHPIAYVYGPQGSAKSTISLVMRKLVDPSRIEVLSMPKSTDELAQQLSHHYFIFYDNVSFIASETSDLLCRAVTGSGFSKRKLYTDQEDIIYNIHANVGINGINLCASQPDLLQRSLLFEISSISNTNRKEGTKLLKEFELERPKILGAIFRTVSRTMGIKPSINLENLPRMADFAIWGCAIAEALGYDRQDFLRIYSKNIESQNEEALESNIVATTIISFMENRPKWSGTTSELLKNLQTEAYFDGIRAKGFPDKPNVLSRQLNVLRPTLENAGYGLLWKREINRRVIIIEKITTDIIPKFEQLSIEMQDGVDMNDDDDISKSF